jgi:predicted DNA-binding transcriptional regulator AlpA
MSETSKQAPPKFLPVPEPLAAGAKILAGMLGISVATFWRWDASGELGPPGIRKGGRRLWPLAEVRAWVSAGMPTRQVWLALTRPEKKEM